MSQPFSGIVLCHLGVKGLYTPKLGFLTHFCAARLNFIDHRTCSFRPICSSRGWLFSGNEFARFGPR